LVDEVNQVLVPPAEGLINRRLLHPAAGSGAAGQRGNGPSGCCVSRWAEKE
jgi:hypothetical protein